MSRNALLTILALAKGAHTYCNYSESEKPRFPLGVLGPFSAQAFYMFMFDIMSAALDFESNDPILTTDLSGRTINSSCFGIDLFIYDEKASQVEARKGALELSLPTCDGKPGIIGLVGGQLPSNCGDSAGITTALQVPQMAYGCAAPLRGDFGYFTRTHQMDFPYAMGTLIKEMRWTRATVVWQPFESFADYNYNLLIDALSGTDIDLHNIELNHVSGVPDYDSWASSVHTAKQYHDRVWIVILGPKTAKKFLPWMYDNGVLEPWMQLLVPGSCKSSIMGLVKPDVVGGPVRTAFEGTLVVLPLSHHKVADGWKAQAFFDRLSSRTLDDFRNSPTAYAEAFDPVDKFGNETVQAMLDDPASLFEATHVWTLAYDALYTFLFAIDDLLRQGHPAGEIKEQLLHVALRAQSFEGTSKRVSFDGGTRPGDWAVESFVQTATGFGWPRKSNYEGGTLVWVSDVDWMTDGAASYDADNGTGLLPERRERCADGHARANASKRECEECPAGAYANEGLWLSLEDPDREICSPCAAGSFAVSPGSRSCTACSSGFDSSEGSAQCEPIFCEAGSRFSVEVQACVTCTADTYKAGLNAVEQCERCPTYSGTSNREGAVGASNCLCVRGYFGTITNSNDTCHACPLEVLQENASACPGGEYIFVPDGLYKEPGTNGVHRCIFADQCIAGTASLAEASTCSNGSLGPVCGTCDDTHVADGKGECKTCDDDMTGFSVFKFIGFLIAIATCTLLNAYSTFADEHAQCLFGSVYTSRCAKDRGNKYANRGTKDRLECSCTSKQATSEACPSVGSTPRMPWGVGSATVAPAPATDTVVHDATSKSPTHEEGHPPEGAPDPPRGRNSSFTHHAIISETDHVKMWQMRSVISEFRRTKDTGLFSPLVRSMINYAQLVSLFEFESIIALAKSSILELLRKLDSVLNVLSFQWAMDVFETGSCTVGKSMLNRTFISMCVPFLISLTIFFLAMLWKLWIPRRGFSEWINASVFSFVCTYTAVLKSVLSNLETIRVAGVSYSTRDTAYEMQSGSMPFITAFSVVYAILVYAVLPGFIIFGLYGRSQRHLSSWRTQLHGRLLYGFISKGYRESTFWWQFVTLMIRFAATLIAVTTTNKLNRSAGLTSLLLISLMLQMTVNPYSKGFLNVIECVNLTCLVVSGFACCLAAGSITSVESNDFMIEYAVSLYCFAQGVYGIVVVMSIVKTLQILRHEAQNRTGTVMQFIAAVISRSAAS